MPRPERIVRLLLLAGLVGVWVPGCASRPDPDRPAARSAEPVEVEIENQNYLDMVVSVDAGGQRIRLALVVGGNTSVARIPASLYLAGPVQMLADPIGPRGGYRSDPLYLSPGDRVLFRIGPQLGLSTVILR